MSLPAFDAPPDDAVALARRVLAIEADALRLTAERLDGRFNRVVARLAGCTGRVAVTGIGKSSDVGQKLVGTFNSTGTRAYLLDATRAVHGDLGMVHPDDVAILLSHSGESEELLRLLPSLRALAGGLVAITGQGDAALDGYRTALAAVAPSPALWQSALAAAKDVGDAQQLLGWAEDAERALGPQLDYRLARATAR